MKTVIIKKLRMMSMWLAVVEEVVTEACMWISQLTLIRYSHTKLSLYLYTNRYHKGL
jgi:hypothetical protein